MKIPERYRNKSIAALKRIAVTWCHKYIRKRDEGLPCISCVNYRKLQAGHFYSAGKFPALKFDEDNIHGQCLQCNYYGSQETGAAYERNLRARIGDERVDSIIMKAQASKRMVYKWNRFTVIEAILKYQEKYKNF